MKMKCPNCQRDSIPFLKVWLKGEWGAFKCPYCGEMCGLTIALLRNISSLILYMAAGALGLFLQSWIVFVVAVSAVFVIDALITYRFPRLEVIGRDRNKKILKSIAYGVILSPIVLAIVLITTSVWLTWAGNREWKIVQAELQAKGEKLTYEELFPTTLQDKDNFYADPMWQELTDVVPVKTIGDGVTYTNWKPRLPEGQLVINQWITPLSQFEKERINRLFPESEHDWTQLQKLPPTEYPSGSERAERLTVVKSLGKELSKTTDPTRRHELAQMQLDLLKPAEPILYKVTELSRRPNATFVIRSSAQFELPQIPYILRFAQILSLRAVAELELGDASAASSDVTTLLRLTGADHSIAPFISETVRVVVVGMALETINSGIAHHQWPDVELVKCQQCLSGINLIREACLMVRVERAFYNSLYPSQIRSPVGIFFRTRPDHYDGITFYELQYYGKSYHNLLMQQVIESLQRHEDNVINVTTPLYNRALASIGSSPIKNWVHFMESLSFQSFDGLIQNFIEKQTQLSQTLIACALERYRLAHGSYPGALDALIPEYLSSIPKEPTTGHPMHYLLIKDGDFLLWAPGWKLMTLNGKPGQYNGEGDIVWNKPISRGSRN